MNIDNFVLYLKDTFNYLFVENSIISIPITIIIFYCTIYSNIKKANYNSYNYYSKRRSK
jgi:hypothetical protein